MVLVGGVFSLIVVYCRRESVCVVWVGRDGRGA